MPDEDEKTGSDAGLLTDLDAVPNDYDGAPTDVLLKLPNLTEVARDGSLTSAMRDQLYVTCVEVLDGRYKDTLDSFAWELEQLNRNLPRLPRALR